MLLYSRLAMPLRVLQGFAIFFGCHHMTTPVPELVQRRIVELEVEHRDLDTVIDAIIFHGHPNELQLRRLKKRKLQLKDHIALLKMQLVPDVPA